MQQNAHKSTVASFVPVVVIVVDVAVEWCCGGRLPQKPVVRGRARVFGIKDRLHVGLFRQPIRQLFGRFVDDGIAFHKVGAVAQNGVSVLTVQAIVVDVVIIVL